MKTCGFEKKKKKNLSQARTEETESMWSAYSEFSNRGEIESENARRTVANGGLGY